MKLRKKLAVVYSAIIIVAVLLGGLISYNISEKALTNEVMRLLESEIDKSSQRIEADLKSWIYKCNYISLSDTIETKLNDNYTGDINKAIDFNNEITAMIMNILRLENVNISPVQSNIEIYSFNNTLIKDEYIIKDSSEFKAYKLDRNAIDNYPDVTWLPVSKMTNGTPVIALCKKLYSRGLSEPTGFLTAYIPIKTFKDEISEIQLPHDGWISYLDSDNNEIFSTNSAQIKPDLLKDITKSTSKRIETRQNFILVSNTPSNGGKLVLSYPRNYFMKKEIVILCSTIVVLFLSVILAIIASYLIAGLITRRLTHFVDSVRLVSTEKTTVNNSIVGNDEIGILNNKFNQMINNLNTLMEESYQTNLKRKTLELELLQYQVNPHYIYNILSAVKSVSDTLRSKTISDIIDSTVKFLRISFNQGNEIISIARELEIIREYISIQLFAFDDTFNVEYSIDPEVNNWYTIKLILQPIIENAIIHGLVKKRDYSGKIKISGKIENDDILFEVEDNGAGMDEDTLIKLSQGDSLKKTSKGYGIRNVQERIQLIFGASYGLSIQSKKNSGTKVTIKIPRYDFKAIENILKKFK